MSFDTWICEALKLPDDIILLSLQMGGHPVNAAATVAFDTGDSYIFAAS